MHQFLPYIPMDRRHAMALGQSLHHAAAGAALFADISGFTPLTAALVEELGAQRGAEELTRYLNLVYDAVIDEVHRYGGSVIAFAGDAITCWLPDDDGRRATAAALSMQAAMEQFSAIYTPAGTEVALAMKAAVAAGTVRRFLVGDPARRVIDALAGHTLVRLANAEHMAERGETVIDDATLIALGDLVEVSEIRDDPEHDLRIGVVAGLRESVPTAPWPTLKTETVNEQQVREWLLPQVYTRLQHGLGDFLAELRPTVALFLRFEGIDYDEDADAGGRLDAYIRWVQEVVETYDGTLVDLNIGDKGSYIYINFGAPQSHEDDADRAAATALALLDQPPELDFIAPVQIGISQGRMRAGAYGGAQHRTYGVLGNEVNMAARLMMAAQPGQALVSDTVQDSLSSTFLKEPLPPIRVKGREGPMNIFALMGMRQIGSSHLSAPEYALPMIGRQDALVEATEKLMQAAAGQGQAITVVGEPGIGKSRLVAEVTRLALTQGFSLYGGECESFGTNSSYLIWQPIWSDIFGVNNGGFLWWQRQMLERQLRRLVPDSLTRIPLLEPLLHLSLPENQFTHTLEPKLRKQLLEDLLVSCLRAKAQQQPLLIVLEDCQWMDTLSYDLLEAIAPQIADLPVLLIGTMRLQEGETNERLERARALKHYTETHLAPLSTEDATNLLQVKAAQLLGDSASLPHTLVERLMAQAEGNPFYLEELLTYLHFRGVDFQNSDTMAQVELPDSLQRLMLSVLDQYSESQKTTVKVASVIGRLFQAAWLHGVYPELGDPRRIHTDLNQLNQQSLLLREAVEPELIYRFRQAITHNVTYESLPHALRAILHEQIGHFIEQKYPETLDQYLDLLAHHYTHSNNHAKQRHYLRHAGEAAQAAYANDAALDYFTRLLPLIDVAEQGSVHLQLGQIHDTIGQYTEAEAHFDAALELSIEDANWSLYAQGKIALGELRRKQSNYDEAAVAFAQAQSVSRQIHDEASMAKALVCAGSLLLYRGEYDAAQRSYAQSLEIRRRLQEPSHIANLLNNMAIASAHQGNLAQASALFAESLGIRRSLNDQWGVGNSLTNLGELALMQEAYPEAERYLEESVEIYREIGDRWSLGYSLMTLGNVLRARGNTREAFPLYQECLQIYRGLGDRRALAYLLESIGGLLSLQGESTQALRLVGAAAALREHLQIPLSAAEEGQLDQMLVPAKQTLGPEAAVAAMDAGRALRLHQAIAEVLDG